jgi:hypothetical protein
MEKCGRRTSGERSHNARGEERGLPGPSMAEHHAHSALRRDGIPDGCPAALPRRDRSSHGAAFHDVFINAAGGSSDTFMDDDPLATAIHESTATAQKPPCNT